MFAKLEAYVHHLRRRLSRSEWAIRHLGLTPSEGASEAPGLVLIQIDGFARGQLERALAASGVAQRRFEMARMFCGMSVRTYERHSKRLTNDDTSSRPPQTAANVSQFNS